MKRDKHFSRPMMSEGISIAENADNSRAESVTTPNATGMLNVRIPKSLHHQLNEEAREEGVALEEYIIYKLVK